MIITKAKLIEDGVLLNGNITLPSANHGHIRKLYDLWLSKGNTPEPQFTQEDLDNAKCSEERQWRDGELALADIELNIVQDGDGYGTVTDWRTYRKELRDYPEGINFPYGVRPIKPRG